MTQTALDQPLPRRAVLTAGGTFGAGLLVAGALALGAGRTPRPSAGPGLEAAAQATAAHLAAALDAQWALHCDVARALQPVVAGGETEKLRPLLNRAQDSASHLTWMGVAAAATARVEVATRGILEGVAVGARPWFAGGLRGDFAGDVHDAVLLQRALNRDERDEPLRLIDYATPLRDAEGRVAAVLGAHLDWQWIRRLIEQGTPQGARVALFDSAGGVIFGPSLVPVVGMARAWVSQAPDAPPFGWSIVAESYPA